MELAKSQKFLVELKKQVSFSLITAMFANMLAPYTAFASGGTFSVTPNTATVGTTYNFTTQYTLDSADYGDFPGWDDGFPPMLIELPPPLAVANESDESGFARMTFTVEYDDDTVNDGVGETAIPVNEGFDMSPESIIPGTYVIFNSTMVVFWDVTTWGPLVDGSSTIRVVVSSGVPPEYVDNTNNKIGYLYTMDFENLISFEEDPAITFSPADAAASITLGDNSVAGEEGDTTINLTIPDGLLTPVEKIEFELPANLDGTFATYVSGTAGAMTCTWNGGVNSCTPTSAFNTGAVSFVLSGIIALDAATNQTAEVRLLTQIDSTWYLQGEDTAASVTDTTGATGVLTLVDVQPASLVAGAVGNVSVQFENELTIPANGKIVIDFPSTFNAAGCDAVSSLVNINGTFSVAVSNGDGTNDVVTLTRQNDGAAVTGGTAVSFIINNVRNPQVSGSTGSYFVSTKTNSGTLIDTGPAEVDTITPGAITSANVEPATLATNSNTSYTISFTTANPIPNGGKISVTFPASFNTAGVVNQVATSLSGLDGTWTGNASGQTVTFVQTGGGSATAGAKSLTLPSGVTTPSSAGTAGSYTITTKNSSDASIDTGTASGDTFYTGVTVLGVTSPTSNGSYNAGDAITILVQLVVM